MEIDIPDRVRFRSQTKKSRHWSNPRPYMRRYCFTHAVLAVVGGDKVETELDSHYEGCDVCLKIEEVGA